jgi:geranylgeranyl reductase family protein
MSALREPGEGGGVSARKETWDLVVVGAGPAGAAAALGALAAAPALRVLLLDRADFPRDKACGDGIAPQVLDVLESVGVRGLLDDWRPVSRLELHQGSARVARSMVRSAWVVPRAVFDARLVDAAVRAGAELRRHRVRSVQKSGGGVVIDRSLSAAVVVGADGAHSVVRDSLGLPPARRRAMAVRGYVPTVDSRRERQVIVFGSARQPSYAWSFDRGDGLANVGYGELVRGGRTSSRREMLAQLERLLPGSTLGGDSWRGHHLPLSSWRFHQPDGPVLLAGDAAGLVNPMTGEGIYYAVATGVLAGRAAAAALTGRPGEWVGGAAGGGAGRLHRRAVHALLGRHLRHTAALSSLVSRPAVVSAGIRAAAHDQRVFDDLVEVGLGRGLIGGHVVRRVAGQLALGRGRAS